MALVIFQMVILNNVSQENDVPARGNNQIACPETPVSIAAVNTLQFVV